MTGKQNVKSQRILSPAFEAPDQLTAEELVHIKTTLENKILKAVNCAHKNSQKPTVSKMMKENSVKTLINFVRKKSSDGFEP